jgi:hypothetical protein
MAFLKETERSLRAYFIVVGIIGTVAGFAFLGEVTKDRYSALPFLASVLVWLTALAPLIIGPSFVIAGINLKRALQTGARGTIRLVKLAALVIVLEIVLTGVALSSAGSQAAGEQTGRAFGRALIPLLLLWYIHASLRRLARESQQRLVATVADKFV